MRLKPYLSPALFWALVLLLLLEAILRSSIGLQFWLTMHNSLGVVSPYLYNRNELKRLGPQVRLLILGDSLPMMAVDARQLARELGLSPLEVFNFSHGGADPASHLKNFLSLSPYLPNLQSVVLFVQPNRLTQRPKDFRLAAETILKESDPWQEAWQQTSLNPLLRHYSLLCQLIPLWNWPPKKNPFPGFRPRLGGGTQMDDIKPEKLRIPEVQPFKLLETALEDLDKLLRTLQGAGLTVRQLSFPYHPDYQAKWQGSDVDRFSRRLFQGYQEEGLWQFYPEVFDHMSSLLPPYYLDYGHLTPSGTAIFTHALAEHLRQHPLPPLR